MLFQMFVTSISVFCINVPTTETIFDIAVLKVSVREVVIFVPKVLRASPTSPAFAEIPSANHCIKSGIQDSKSVRGPSSGTEKCRKDLILSATPVTASAAA